MPWRIPDDTSIDDRLRLLEAEAARAIQTAEFRRLAMRLSSQVPWDASDRNWRLGQAILKFVQSLPFRPDPPGEFFQTGVYTLANGGDCEDLSVVVVALARLLGLTAQLLWITQDGQALNHVSANLWLNGQWTWADGSVKGAMLGESPYDAVKRIPPVGDHTVRSELVT